MGIAWQKEKFSFWKFSFEFSHIRKHVTIPLSFTILTIWGTWVVGNVSNKLSRTNTFGIGISWTKRSEKLGTGNKVSKEMKLTSLYTCNQRETVENITLGMDILFYNEIHRDTQQFFIHAVFKCNNYLSRRLMLCFQKKNKIRKLR